jgi:surfactin synthase thioesterase subunit
MRHARPRVAGDWLLIPAPQEHRPFRLFCFPHAGGDATAYTMLARAIAPAAEVWALRLPARGGRSAQPMPGHFDLLVRTVAAELAPHFDGPFGFYGQSLGALLAYEVTREVARTLPHAGHPEVVIAASAEPPEIWAECQPGYGGPEELLRGTGMSDVVGADTELRALTLATIQADLEVSSSYRYRPGPPIESDLYAMVGDADPMLTMSQLAGWADYTAGSFGLSAVPGGHLLATAQRPGPVDVLASVLGLRPRCGALATTVGSGNGPHQY